MKLFDATVLVKEPVAARHYMMQIGVGAVARECRAGQFLHIRCSRRDSLDPLLRRPLSISRIDDEALWLYFEVVGPGTRFLADLSPGAELDVLGALGRPFQVRGSSRNLLLVGEGAEIAPLIALAFEATRAELSVTLLAGFRDGNDVLDAHYLPAQVEYVVATLDGSVGHASPIAELAGHYLDWSDQIFTAGPDHMLESLRRITAGSSRSIQVAIGETIACGVGACSSCVVRTRNGLKRVCRDGPVFELRDLREMGWRVRW